MSWFSPFDLMQSPVGTGLCTDRFAGFGPKDASETAVVLVPAEGTPTVKNCATIQSYSCSISITVTFRII